MGTPGLNVGNTIQGMGDRVEKRRVKKKTSIDICSFFLLFSLLPFLPDPSPLFLLSPLCLLAAIRELLYSNVPFPPQQTKDSGLVSRSKPFLFRIFCVFCLDICHSETKPDKQ